MNLYIPQDLYKNIVTIYLMANIHQAHGEIGTYVTNIQNS